jgi:hypothetical protein
MSTRLIKLQSS